MQEILTNDKLELGTILNLYLLNDQWIIKIFSDHFSGD